MTPVRVHKTVLVKCIDSMIQTLINESGDFYGSNLSNFYNQNYKKKKKCEGNILSFNT